MTFDSYPELIKMLIFSWVTGDSNMCMRKIRGVWYLGKIKMMSSRGQLHIFPLNMQFHGNIFLIVLIFGDVAKCKMTARWLLGIKLDSTLTLSMSEIFLSNFSTQLYYEILQIVSNFGVFAIINDNFSAFLKNPTLIV